MSSSKKSPSSDLWLSLGFFLVYAGYFISYFYEMFYIFRYNFDFLLFGSIFLCSVSSVMLTSVCLMVITFILVIVCASMEMYFYVDFMFVLFPKENFLRLFFYGRVVSAMLYIIMFVFYLNNAKMVREQEMEELKEIEEHIKDYNRRVLEAAAQKNRRANEQLAQKKAMMQNPNPHVYYQPQANGQAAHYYPATQPMQQPTQYAPPRTEVPGAQPNGDRQAAPTQYLNQPPAAPTANANGQEKRYNGLTENSFGVRTDLL